jgi:hypothetical protein
MAGLVAWLFEMDVADGLIVAVVTWLSWVGIFVFLQNALV